MFYLQQFHSLSMKFYCNLVEVGNLKRDMMEAADAFVKTGERTIIRNNKFNLRTIPGSSEYT